VNERSDISPKQKVKGSGGFRIGRRGFLIDAGLAAGALVSATSFSSASSAAAMQAGAAAHDGHVDRSFKCSSEPHRFRKSFYDLTDAEVRLLCSAVGYMRNGIKDKPLSVDSPVQWDQWVMTHARHCTEAKPGVVDQVHWSWFFLPWHRAYLWFLERQLANVVTTVLGQDGSKFALPYWDWISHKEIPNTRERAVNGAPSPLFGYDLSKENMVNDDGLGFDNQGLWDGYRKPTPQYPTMDPKNELTTDSKEHIEETIKYMSPESIQFMLLLDFEDFAGRAVAPQAAIPTPDGMGILEHYPHNNGHDWVGSRFGKNRNMGNLRYAALDPIFFMHHANIDRVWSLYQRPQPDPDVPWGSHKYIWGKQSYSFTDIDGSAVIVTVSDIVKCMTNITYVEPQVSPAIAAFSPQSVAQATNERMMTLVQSTDTLTTKPLTVQGQPQPEVNKLLGIFDENRTHPLSLLIVETGPIRYSDKFTIKVFVNKPDADRLTSIHDVHYVGSIRALDSASRIHETEKDITHFFSIMIAPSDSNFYNLVKPGESFSVTLVPVGPSQRDESFRIPVKSIKLKVYE